MYPLKVRGSVSIHIEMKGRKMRSKRAYTTEQKKTRERKATAGKASRAKEKFLVF